MIKSTKGVAVLMTAIMMPIFLMLFCLMVDFGNQYSVTSRLERIADEAADLTAMSVEDPLRAEEDARTFVGEKLKAVRGTKGSIEMEYSIVGGVPVVTLTGEVRTYFMWIFGSRKLVTFAISSGN